MYCFTERTEDQPISKLKCKKYYIYHWAACNVLQTHNCQSRPILHSVLMVYSRFIRVGFIPVFPRIHSGHVRVHVCEPHLLMVNGWRAGCCLGMQIMLGELRLGLPSPELPMLLVLPLMPKPGPTWEWFIMFLVFMGRIPLLDTPGRGGENLGHE